MTHILTWEAVNTIHEQQVGPKRIRLIVRSPDPQTGRLGIIDIGEPLAKRTEIWNHVDQLKEMFPDLTWEDTGAISLVEQIEAELL